MLAEQITGGRVEMRTAGVAAIDLLADTWQGLGQATGMAQIRGQPTDVLRLGVGRGRSGRRLNWAPEQSDLRDVTWRLVGMIDDSDAFIPVLGDVVITALFDDQDRVSGSSGCNRYTGPAMLAEDVLSIGAVAGTRMMCSDSQVMAQESRYLGLLARVASYRISAGRRLPHSRALRRRGNANPGIRGWMETREPHLNPSRLNVVEKRGVHKPPFLCHS